jgi:uncharacterized membrane protein YidH (DUF202 family)
MVNFDETYDPGLQQERTVLAWDRTGLALMVAAGILQREIGWPLRLPISLVSLATFFCGLTVVIVDRPRYLARSRRMRQGEGMLEAGPVLIVASATVLLGFSALLLVLQGGLD